MKASGYALIVVQSVKKGEASRTYIDGQLKGHDAVAVRRSNAERARLGELDRLLECSLDDSQALFTYERVDRAIDKVLAHLEKHSRAIERQLGEAEVGATLRVDPGTVRLLYRIALKNPLYLKSVVVRLFVPDRTLRLSFARREGNRCDIQIQNVFFSLLKVVVAGVPGARDAVNVSVTSCHVALCLGFGEEGRRHFNDRKDDEIL